MEKRLLLLLLGLCVGTGLFAQVKVTGVVLAASDDEPLIGATVSVKGNATAVATDLDGKFAITVPSANSQLEVKYVGMETVVVKAQTTPMKIMMESSSTELDEVVVTGMQKMDKRLFTGAATKVDAQAARIGGMADISRSLEGRAAGVSVQNVSRYIRYCSQNPRPWCHNNLQ